jgi:uncharacterized protein (TIGR02588 family)
MRPLPSPEWLERLIFAISLVLVLGVAGALVVFDRPFESNDTAIVPRVRDEALDRTPERLVVPFEVTNRGRVSVDDVTIEVVLAGQRREQHFSHLPEGATQRGVVVFYQPPPGARPAARVLGFQVP